MPLPVVSGATIACTMGQTGQLIASQATILIGGAPAATITDAAPNTNITPCGMCTSMANPTVASATSAALGVLTPMPCVPVPAGTWICGCTTLIGGKPGLDNTGKIMCSYGGTINIVSPGQTTVVFG